MGSSSYFFCVSESVKFLLSLFCSHQILSRWVTEQTNGRMVSLLEKEPGSETRLLVGSVARISPRWLYPFDPAQTSKNGLFFLPGGGR